MSLSLVLAPLLILGAPGDAKDRFIKWRSSATSLSFTQAVTISAPNVQTISIKASFKQSPGLKLRYDAYFQSGALGQIQNGTVVMATNSQTKTYAKYYGIPRISGPSPSAPAMLSHAFPGVLTDPTLAAIRSNSWKVKGDTLSMTEETEMGEVSIKINVAKDGSIKGYEISMEGERPYSAKSTFSNISTAPIPDSTYSLRPPLGWVPQFIKEPARPWDIGSKPTVRVYRDGLKGSTFDLLSSAQAQGSVVCLVAADCPVSARLISRLDSLKAELSKKKLGLRIISLGSQKPTAWSGKVFWDQSGAVEKDLAPPSTPYFYTFDKKGVITSAWLGFVSGEEAKIATILAAKSEQ